MDFELDWKVIENAVNILAYMLVAIDLTMQLALAASGRVLEIKYGLEENEYQEIEYDRSKAKYKSDELLYDFNYTRKLKVECVRKSIVSRTVNIRYNDESALTSEPPFIFKFYNGGKWSMTNWRALKKGCRKGLDETFDKVIEEATDELHKKRAMAFKKNLKRAFTTKSDIKKRGLGSLGVFLGLYGLKAKKSFNHLNRYSIEDSIGLYEIEQVMNRFIHIDQINESHYEIRLEAVIYGGKQTYATYFMDKIDDLTIVGDTTMIYSFNATYDNAQCVLTKLEYLCTFTMDEYSIVEQYKFRIGNVKKGAISL